MKLPDANVLLYAADGQSRHHSRARAWVELALSDTETVGLATIVLLAFLRIATNPRIASPALSVDEALDQVDEWLKQPPAVLLHPGARHFAMLRSLLNDAGTAGNLTSDAHLAALALEHNATLATFDGDFHRFGGLKLDYLGARPG